MSVITPKLQALILQATRRKPKDGSTHWQLPVDCFRTPSVRYRNSIDVVDHQELDLGLVAIETQPHLIFQGRENG